MQGQGRPNVPGHATGTVEVVVMCRKRLADALAVLEVKLRRSKGGSLAEMMQSGWHAAIRQGSAFTGCTGTVTTGTADKGYQCSLYLSNNGQSRGRACLSSTRTHRISMACYRVTAHREARMAAQAQQRQSAAEPPPASASPSSTSLHPPARNT